MKKLTRREFFKLSAIWGTVPFIPKWLSFKEDVPGEEELEEEAIPNPWNEDSSPSPYFLEGGTSIRAWRRGEGESAIDWYTRMESEE